MYEFASNVICKTLQVMDVGSKSAILEFARIGL